MADRGVDVGLTGEQVPAHDPAERIAHQDDRARPKRARASAIASSSTPRSASSGASPRPPSESPCPRRSIEEGVKPALGERGRPAASSGGANGRRARGRRRRSGRADRASMDLEMDRRPDRGSTRARAARARVEVERRERPGALARRRGSAESGPPACARRPRLARRAIDVARAAGPAGRGAPARTRASVIEGSQPSAVASAAEPAYAIAGDRPVGRRPGESRSACAASSATRAGGPAREPRARRRARPGPPARSSRRSPAGTPREVAKHGLAEGPRDVVLMDSCVRPPSSGSDRERRSHQRQGRVGEVRPVDESRPQAGDARGPSGCVSLPAVEQRARPRPSHGSRSASGVGLRQRVLTRRGRALAGAPWADRLEATTRRRTPARRAGLEHVARRRPG